MPAAIHSLEELVAAFRGNEMKLPALFEALGERGAVTDEQHAGDVAWLEHLRDAEGLDPRIVNALVSKLGSLQPVVAAVVAVAPEDDAATRMHASAAVVQPASPAVATSGNTQAGTSASDTPGTSSWQQVAGAAASEFATVGMLLKGRFLLEREIGRGGMGVVYLARDDRKVEARDRDPYVAVKVLNDEFRRHPDSLIALQRESRRSQRLAHDNIVRAYDFDKDGTIVFMTMEYVDGSSLKSVIREQAFDGMHFSKAWPLIEGMARALGRAHAAGVVHSDFKPGNVMVTKDWVAKVFDFGIARAGKLQGAAAGDQTVFDAGTLGAMTPAYASLEMLRGEEPTPADDIYALGCVVYELLTGKHPFDRVSAEVALQEGRTPPLVHGLTQWQAKTLRKAVALHREQRLQSTDKLVEGLRERGLGERIGRPLGYALLVALVLAGTGWGLFSHWREQQVAKVVEGFQPKGAQRYATATQAIAALADLGNNERRQLIVEHGDVVQQFLVDRVDAYWDPAAGRRDYASAEKVFADVGKLRLFLPQLDVKRAEVEKQKFDIDHPQPAQVAAANAPASATAEVAPATTATSPALAQADAAAQAARASAEKQAADAAQQAAAAAAAKARMREVATGLLRTGEGNFAQQKYSAAIANATAALQINPDDPGAKRLLEKARQAQKQAMSGITIH